MRRQSIEECDHFERMVQVIDVGHHLRSFLTGPPTSIRPSPFPAKLSARPLPVDLDSNGLGDRQQAPSKPKVLNPPPATR